ncbi:hypothetical protein [Micromonospora sp. IBHARD004]|uniref:hypothetical protein n=1 Tax=Micromonospora sp. IBHARD004 TaxID=3457764 RepID=UPI004059F5B5
MVERGEIQQDGVAMGDWLPEPTRAQMSLDAVLHALSDPHRRRIVAMLAAEPRVA